MTRRLEPQDLYAIKLVEDPQITPDGRRVAYVVVEIDRKTYDYHRTIWVSETAQSLPRRYTAGDNDTAPRWSPDGRSLVFVRAPAGEVKPKNEEERDRGVGKGQLWLLPADGGEARQLTWARWAPVSPYGHRTARPSSIGRRSVSRTTPRPRTPACTRSGSPPSGESTACGIGWMAWAGPTKGARISSEFAAKAASPSN